MIDEAEAQRNADAELHDRIDKLNEAKGMLYMAERSLKQLNTYLPEEDKAAFTEELNAHREYLDNDPTCLLTEDVEATKKALEDLAQKIAEIAYKAMS